jgi:chaperonin GroES
MIKPIRDQILVKPYPSENISAGGIIVSDAHKADSNKMMVVAVGNGTKKDPIQFKEGDTAFRVKDHGDEVIIAGEKYFLIKQSYLIAKMN